MQIVAHPSPLVLEEELCDRVAAAKAGDPLAPVLIVVPSRRLAEHVERRLVERFGVVLGVEILHHAALAERILDGTGGRRPEALHDAVLETLTATVVRQAPAGPLRDFARDHPGAAAALGNTLVDLREAGIDPGAVDEVLGESGREIAGLYALWTSALEGIGERAADAAGFAIRAIPLAPAFASRFAAILHHGAYDLIGVRVELVRALDRGRELVFLLPAHATEPAGAFGIAKTRAIGGEGAAWHAVERESTPLPASFFNAQGGWAELATAARGALAAVAAGVPPHEVAVVVRAFTPYLAAVDTLVDADGPRWHTSYRRPLRRDSGVGAALRAIAGSAGTPEGTFAAHAGAFEATARAVMGEDGWKAPAGIALSGLLDAMRQIESLLGDRRVLPRGEATAWLAARVDASKLAPDGADGGGIRLLDAMQARGLTFRRIAICGMNAGVFPRIGRDDPFLDDETRRRLAAATGRPLPLGSDSDGEEHLLLAMLMGAASERLSVSWRRADDGGRPVVASLALRDVARATGTGTDAASVEDAAHEIPAHPRSRLESWARDPGVLSPSEETLLMALASETGAESGRALVERSPELSSGVALIEATDSFAPGNGAYDARVGPGIARAKLAVTAVERLGRCPLQYFFRDVLRVAAAPEPPTPLEAGITALGSRVHGVLQGVYGKMLDEGAFRRTLLPGRIARARALLPEAWIGSATEADTARALRWPVFDRISSDRWTAALDAFLEADLTRMEAEHVAPDRLEHGVEARIEGALDGIVLSARFDRELLGADGRIVGDYKTRGSLAKRVKATAMLKGEALQVPLYGLLAGAPVELLGVGPEQVPAPGSADDERFARFDGFENEAQRAGMLETLNVLGALASSGRFPLRSGEHCNHCEYRPACRRQHPPTEHREELASDGASLRACREKTAKQPMLADVGRGAS